MTKTNAQTAVKTRAAKAANKPAATKVDKDAIVQSSGSRSGEHFIRSVGGESFSFPTAQWRGETREVCGIGKSFKAAVAHVKALPEPAKATLARGVTGRDAPQSSKAVADANGHGKAKTSNKADAATQKPKAAKPAKTDEKAAKLAASDARKITFVAENPKRPGTASFDRFAKYKKGMTVAQALEAGVTRADIDWDSKREFIKFA